MANAKPASQRTLIDAIRDDEINSRRLAGLSRALFAGVAYTSSQSGGTGRRGSDDNVQNQDAYLRTAGDTMVGPIAFYPVATTIASGVLDISRDTTSSFTSYVFLSGEGAVDDTLVTITGAAHAGQILYIQPITTTELTVTETGGNIKLPGTGSDVVVNADGNGTAILKFIFDISIAGGGNKWVLVSNNESAGGSGVTFPIEPTVTDNGAGWTNNQTLNLATGDGHVYKWTIDQDLIFVAAVSGKPSSGTQRTFELEFEHDGVGGTFTVTLPSNFVDEKGNTIISVKVNLNKTVILTCRINNGTDFLIVQKNVTGIIGASEVFTWTANHDSDGYNFLIDQDGDSGFIMDRDALIADDQLGLALGGIGTILFSWTKAGSDGLFSVFESGSEAIQLGKTSTEGFINSTDLLKLQIAGTDVFGISNSQATFDQQVSIEKTTTNPLLTLFRNDASPNDGDSLGLINFSGKDDAANTQVYAQIDAISDDVSSGSEDSSIRLITSENAGLTTILKVGSTFLEFTNETTNPGGAELRLYSNRASPLDDDILSQITVSGETDTGAKADFAELRFISADVSNASKDASLTLRLMTANSLSTVLTINDTSDNAFIIHDLTFNLLDVSSGEAATFHKSSTALTISSTDLTQLQIAGTTKLQVASASIDLTPSAFSLYEFDDGFFRYVQQNGSAQIVLFNDDATPADASQIAKIFFDTNDSLGNKVTFGSITAIVDDVTNSSKDAQIQFAIRSGNTLVDAFIIQGDDTTTIPRLGFRGATAQSVKTYSRVTTTTDRALSDASTIGTAELAHVLGTLLDDLSDMGIITGVT